MRKAIVASMSRKGGDGPQDSGGDKEPTPSSSAPDKSTVDIELEPRHIECSICLRSVALYPVVIPCGHTFCFLCIKGAASRNHYCALCRSNIPCDYFANPKFVHSKNSNYHERCEDEEKATAGSSKYKWFYEGRHGWWQYDDASSNEIEDAYKNKKKEVSLLIAGHLYVINVKTMDQRQRDHPNRVRKIKRDLQSALKKGIAGVQLSAIPNSNSLDTDSPQLADTEAEASLTGDSQASFTSHRQASCQEDSQVPAPGPSGESGCSHDAGSLVAGEENVATDVGLNSVENSGRSSSDSSRGVDLGDAGCDSRGGGGEGGTNGDERALVVADDSPGGEGEDIDDAFDALTLE